MDDRSFHEFEQLTSVHVNSTDEHFIASGSSNHVALYDISSGRRLQIFKDLHREHINVVKFANHSPAVFASASFDRQVKLWDLRQEMSRPCYSAASSRGNVMVCFSDDDHYLLSSAIDNEVPTLEAIIIITQKARLMASDCPHSAGQATLSSGRKASYVIQDFPDWQRAELHAVVLHERERLRYQREL